MVESAPVNTPVKMSCKLSMEDESPFVDSTLYKSMVGSLLFLIVSRVDIMQAIRMVGRFQSSPKNHMNWLSKEYLDISRAHHISVYGIQGIKKLI